MEKYNLHNNYEQSIRSCYQEFEFVAMIQYDAIFIVELFLKLSAKDKPNFLISNPQTRFAIWLELQLLENQLPFFILNELYKLAFPYSDPNNLFYLSCAFFWHGTLNELPTGVDVKHFTDLRRYSIINIHLQTQSTRSIIYLPSAHKLHESGVNFKRFEGKCLVDFEKAMNPGFKHELQIPHIEKYDETGCLIRNLMALEQSLYPHQELVCSYIDLIDELINTEVDFNLLIEAGIISSHVRDNAKVADMFNKLCLQIDIIHTPHYEIIRDLKEHYDNPWNYAKATLVYFSNRWRGTGTAAAVMLILLTLIQAICCILQLVLFS